MVAPPPCCSAANWKEELQEYISPDQLPQAYGGTRCEPDPMCSDFVSFLGGERCKFYLLPTLLSFFLVLWPSLPHVQINIGGDVHVPPEYYLINHTHIKKGDMERVIVCRGSSCKMEFSVEHPGTVIK